jgi:hypothetical protein
LVVVLVFWKGFEEAGVVLIILPMIKTTAPAIAKSKDVLEEERRSWREVFLGDMGGSVERAWLGTYGYKPTLLSFLVCR